MILDIPICRVESLPNAVQVWFAVRCTWRLVSLGATQRRQRGQQEGCYQAYRAYQGGLSTSTRKNCASQPILHPCIPLSITTLFWEVRPLGLEEALGKAPGPPRRLRGPWAAKFALIFPGGVDGLGYYKRRIRSCLRSEFLYAPVIHLGQVEVSVLVNAQAMNAPESARKIAHRSPRVEQVSLQVPLDHLVGGAVKGPDGIARSDVQEMQTRWIGVDFPFAEVFAVLVEDLDTVIVAVVHENLAGLLIDGDPVDVAE